MKCVHRTIFYHLGRSFLVLTSHVAAFNYGHVHWLQNETKCGNNKFDHLIVLYTEFDLRAPTPTFGHCAGEDVWPLLALEVSWVSWHVQNVRRRGVVEESKTSEPQCLESHLGLSLRFANCEQLDLMH